MDITRSIDQLLQWIFPARCILCGGNGLKHEESVLNLCHCCYLQLPRNRAACEVCAIPVQTPARSNQVTICGRCLNKKPGFDYSYSLFKYEQPVVWLIQQLKYNHKLAHATLLGQLMAGEVIKQYALNNGCDQAPGCLLPVPLHNKRLAQRGFNQSIELAKVISRKTGIYIERNLVIKTRDTSSQSSLKADQRYHNVKGSFAINADHEYGHVAIIDDVVTTGATTNELAKVLKKSGVKRVDVWSIARASF